VVGPRRNQEDTGEPGHSGPRDPGGESAPPLGFRPRGGGSGLGFWWGGWFEVWFGVWFGARFGAWLEVLAVRTDILDGRLYLGEG